MEPEQKGTPSEQATCQPSATISVDMHEMEDEFEELKSLFSEKYGYCICPETGRVVVNVPEGMAVVENGKMKKYYDSDSPFRGKAGVKLSSVLPFSNLIAVVPNKEAAVTYQIPDISEEVQGLKQTFKAMTLLVMPTTVYIYDMVERTIVYEKDFNCHIDYLKISNSFIAVSNAERVVIFDYKKKQKEGPVRKNEVLMKLINNYERGQFDNTVRYVDVEGVGRHQRGKLAMSLSQPVRLAFIKKQRYSLFVFDSKLGIFMDIPMNKDETDFCLSPDGKLVALISEGGITIRIVDVDTRQTFTQFKRGSSQKDTAFAGFCESWFGFASCADSNATMHLFPLKKRNDNSQVIYSQYKRYFNTFREPTNFIIKDSKVKIFSLVGCGFDAIDLVRAKAKHAEDASRVIKVRDVTFWSVQP